MPVSLHICLSHRRMRGLIPLDIYKSSIKQLVKSGLPEATATRIWNCKILWLISTNKEDIRKVPALSGIHSQGRHFFLLTTATAC